MGLKDEQGMMAIGVALMLIVVLALFGGVLWQYSMAEMGRVERAEHDMQALFLARAGAEVVLGAWLESSMQKKPSGDMDRLYCVYEPDNESYRLLDESGTDPLGYVDVTINEIDEPGTRRHEIIEIIAIADVNGVKRTAKLVSYPRARGHDPELDWYDDSTGGILDNSEKEKNYKSLVIVQTKDNEPIHFARGLDPPKSSGFNAPIIRFETNINFAYDQKGIRAPLGADALKRDLPIRAEMIYFQDVVMLEMPAGKGILANFGKRDFIVTLHLPERSLDGSESGVLGKKLGIEENKPEASTRYGKVFFEGSGIQIKHFHWVWDWDLLNTTIQPTGATTTIKSFEKPEDNRRFYFKDGTDLSNPGPLDLIPIPPGEEEIDLKEIRAFYWE